MRKTSHYHGTELIEETMRDMDWRELRDRRDQALDKSDWRVMPDREESQEWLQYRAFLRDLPQNFPGELANDACDAWDAYDKPEGA